MSGSDVLIMFRGKVCSIPFRYSSGKRSCIGMTLLLKIARYSSETPDVLTITKDVDSPLCMFANDCLFTD